MDNKYRDRLRQFFRFQRATCKARAMNWAIYLCPRQFKPKLRAYFMPYILTQAISWMNSIPKDEKTGNLQEFQAKLIELKEKENGSN